MAKCIYLIDSRGVITTQKDDAQRRHKAYADKLSLLEPDSNFYIFSSVDEYKPDESDKSFHQKYIQCNSRISIKYILKCVILIRKSNPSSAIFVSGDPWEPAITALIISTILRILFRVNYPIQIQIHAEITDPHWFKASYINRIRYLIAKVILKRAKQIRVVSEKLKNELIERSIADPSKVFISAVELNLPNQIDCLNFKDRPRAIGFAGRFHRDRSTMDFIKYVKKLNPAKNNLDVVLAGHGELLNETLSQLAEFVPAQKLEYCGNLPASDMHEFWRKIGAYVSVAKSESYGRSIREAVSCGIPVLGVKSNGFRLIQEFDVPWIRELVIEDSPEALLVQLETMLNIETSDYVKLKLQEQSIASNRILLESWLRLLEKN